MLVLGVRPDGAAAERFGVPSVPWANSNDHPHFPLKARMVNRERKHSDKRIQPAAPVRILQHGLAANVWVRVLYAHINDESAKCFCGRSDRRLAARNARGALSDSP